MPVAAVAGAVFAGVEIATVGIAAMTAFEVVAAVGAIASGIGALTGNEDLMKIGGIASLAGGIGAFAQGKGWLPSDGGSSAAADAGNIGAMKGTAAPGVEAATPVVDTGAVDFGQAAGSNAVELGQVAEAGKALDMPSLTQNITAPSQEIASAGSEGLMNASNAKDTLLARKDYMPGASSTSVMPGEQSKSIFDSIGNFASKVFKNPDGTMNKDMLSLAGNFVGGLFDDKKQAEGDYLKARTAELESQMRNANAIPDMRNLRLAKRPIFPQTSPTYRPPGLMHAR